MSAPVQVSHAEGIATLAFDREEALNALDTGLARAIQQALLELDADAAVEGIVLTGRGRAFCAGADLAEAAGQTPDTVPAWFSTLAETYRAILSVDKPVIAAINGTAAGAGFQISLVSDMRVAARGARLGQPEINAGIPSIMGSYWMSLHLPRAVNQDLSLTGRLMDTEEATRHGLLQKVVEAEDLLEEATALARALAAKSPPAWAATKARFRLEALSGFDAALAEAISGQQEAFRAGEPQRILAEFLARKAARGT